MRRDELPGAAVSDGRLLVGWREDSPVGIPPVCLEQRFILARAFEFTCSPSATRLCLQGGRFAVEVRLPNPESESPLDRARHRRCR